MQNNNKDLNQKILIQIKSHVFWTSITTITTSVDTNTSNQTYFEIHSRILLQKGFQFIE